MVNEAAFLAARSATEAVGLPELVEAVQRTRCEAEACGPRRVVLHSVHYDEGLLERASAWSLVEGLAVLTWGRRMPSAACRCCGTLWFVW